MNRTVLWAPLNIGVFLIDLALVLMLGFLQVAGLTLASAVPLVFAIFGAWLIVASFIFPPSNTYAAPRIMVLIWGALVFAFGLAWLVGVYSLELLPIIFAVLLLLAGIGIVGYAFMKAENKKSSGPTPAPPSP